MMVKIKPSEPSKTNGIILWLEALTLYLNTPESMPWNFLPNDGYAQLGGVPSTPQQVTLKITDSEVSSPGQSVAVSIISKSVVSQTLGSVTDAPLSTATVVSVE